MNAPQVIVLIMLIMMVIFIPSNSDENWEIYYSLGMRLARAALWAGLLWWGGFWGG